MKKVCIIITSLILLFFFIYTPFKISKILEYKDIETKEKSLEEQETIINDLTDEINNDNTLLQTLKDNDESNKEKLELWKKEVKKIQENL